MKRCFWIALVSLAVRCSQGWPCSDAPRPDYLDVHYDLLYALPRPDFENEARILLTEESVGPLPDVSVPTPELGGGWEATLEADTKDLHAQLSSNHSQDIEAIVEEYRALRVAMHEVRLARRRAREARYSYGGRSQESPSPPEPFDLAPYEPLLAKIPAEFVAYARGVAAYESQNSEEAIVQWGALLAMPKEERPYKTIWAAFMLGKACLDKDPKRSVDCFKKVPELAGEGFEDSLGLSEISLPWQAHAETLAGQYVEAIHHYAALALVVATSEMARQSLSWTCSKAIASQSIELELVRDPLCCRVMMAYALYAGASRQWLDAVERLDPRGKTLGAEKLAWAAYNGGNMERAGRWLKRADPNDQTARRVRAKLLLREGKIDEAIELLRKLAPEIERPNEPYSELGVLYLGKGKFVKALDAFLQGRNPGRESYYIAVCILTVDELELFIKEHEGDPFFYSLDSDYGRDPIDMLKDVLACRLAEEGRWIDAAPLYTRTRSYCGSSASEIAKEIEYGHDMQLAAEERAKHFFTAAKLVRDCGAGLVAPEISYYQRTGIVAGPGEYDNHREPFVPPKGILAATDEEIERVKRHLPQPNKHLHYRYKAAELMWECAQLLPDNDPLEAEALYLGGSYIAAKDPEAANRFYTALARRNPGLEIGREAEALRWFPKRFTDEPASHAGLRRFRRKRLAAYLADRTLCDAFLPGASIPFSNALWRAGTFALDDPVAFFENVEAAWTGFRTRDVTSTPPEAETSSLSSVPIAKEQAAHPESAFDLYMLALGLCAVVGLGVYVAVYGPKPEDP